MWPDERGERRREREGERERERTGTVGGAG